jgi:hypothetical protein
MAQAWMRRVLPAWRGNLPFSRVAVVCVITALLSGGFAVWTFPASAVVVVVETKPAPAAGDKPVVPGAQPVVAAARKPRVLLMGDSVMDQQGNHAAFELRLAGIDARVVGLWGSSLLTRDQYDHGKTRPNGIWLARASQEIATFNPEVVAVYLNHNYWPPFPRDAAGNVIESLSSTAGQKMLRTQAAALITKLRARGARVFFVAPVPAGSVSNPDPAVWNPIWRGYLPVLNRMQVPVIDSAVKLRGPDGLRVETKPGCTGAEELIRPPDDLHLARYGAGLAGTELAKYIAREVGRSLDGNGAPGERTAALVPTPDGRGYWLIGCDGSVYPFGTAPHLPGARAAMAAHRGVAAAAATRDGKGLWLVAGDGKVAAVGDAAPMKFRTRAASTITGAFVTPDGKGFFATTSTGAVLTAGTARGRGSLSGRRLNGSIVDIEPTRDGKGYWLVGSDGGIFSFGTARFFGSMGGAKLNGRIVAMAATPDNKGYWQVGADGGIFSFGDARYLGNGRWVTPAYPLNLITVAPGPAVDVVAARGRGQGYWVVGETGRVTNSGTAVGHAGTDSMALFSQ